MYDAILIANRAEIALRIMRTCRRLGIRCVVVHSQHDADAFHVREADAAVCIPASSGAGAYLSREAIVQAAVTSGVTAVHPGYGFLSEDPEFAAQVEDAGLVFVGPRPETIRGMGDKVGARVTAAAAGVPLSPGTPALGPDDDIKEAAAELGYPVIVKLVAGGGGIGMRRVDDASGLQAAVEAARKRGQRFFGDGRVYLEQFIEGGRHVEVQVVGDGRGRAVHLFDRDCSIQRRHQKVVEEAPAPALPSQVSEPLRRSAVDLATHLCYRGAGTVEFMVSGSTFHFLEMNTRLQVEHPVTEAITGIDLVEWQLQVAATGQLPVSDQAAIHQRGAAVEGRLYAEDPDTFLPAAGPLNTLTWPAPGEGHRVDPGYEQHDEVTVDFDPLIAKLIAWGEDRPSALARFSAMLEETDVSGTTTNLPRLRAIVKHPDFRSADYTTSFLNS